MKIQMFIAMFLICLLCVSVIHVEATTYPIVNPKGSNLHLNTCETDSGCTFTSTQELSGSYEFGFDPVCDNGEQDGCVTLSFYPDSDYLPYFDGWKIKSVNITNYIEAAEKLMDKGIVEKAISSGRSVEPDKAGYAPSKVIVVKGIAEILIGSYSMGICCDSSYANAKVLKVKKKSQPKMEEENAWGPSAEGQQGQ